ncbi:MAG: hypothetical protein U0869_19380 [Chloroflexota bacterium]
MDKTLIADLGAIVFLVAAVIGIVFQVAVALGAPWGEYTQGGRWPGKLPPVSRALALAQAVILGLLAFILLSATGIVVREATASQPNVVWFPVVVSGASLWLNLNSHSPKERRTWTPLAAVMLVSSAVTALALR